MPAPCSATTTLSFRLAPQPLDTLTQSAGLTATDDFNPIPASGTAHFHRVFLPPNAEHNYAGTGPINDSFQFLGFPGLENNISGDPVLDFQGLPLTFATLTLIALEIRPIRPIAGLRASTVLTSNNTNVSDGDAVTIDGTVKIFKTTLTPAADEVLRGANADASLLNLSRSINFLGTPGTDYVGTEAHPTVRASTAVTAHAIELTAAQPGTAGNAIATSTTAPTLTFPDATLTGGLEVDPANTPRGLEGTVRLQLTGDLIPGSLDFTFTEPGLFQIATPWTPGTSGQIDLTFATTEPAPSTAAHVNAAATLLLIGTA